MANFILLPGTFDVQNVFLNEIQLLPYELTWRSLDKYIIVCRLTVVHENMTLVATQIKLHPRDDHGANTHAPTIANSPSNTYLYDITTRQTSQRPNQTETRAASIFQRVSHGVACMGVCGLAKGVLMIHGMRGGEPHSIKITSHVRLRKASDSSTANLQLKSGWFPPQTKTGLAGAAGGHDVWGESSRNGEESDQRSGSGGSRFRRDQGPDVGW